MPNEMSARNIQLKTFSSILFQDMPIIFKNGKVHIFAEIPGIKQSILPMTSLKNSRIALCPGVGPMLPWGRAKVSS